MNNRKTYLYIGIISLLFWLNGHPSSLLYAQTITDTQHPKYKVAASFFKALQKNKFNCLQQYVVSQQQLQQSFEKQAIAASPQKAKQIRKQLLQTFRHKFKQTRQQATHQGINWKKAKFVNCEYNSQQLYNLRFFFSYQQKTYWIALEVYQYDFSNQHFLRENIYSQFEKRLATLPYQANNNSIPDSLFLPPVGNIDSLYHWVQQQDQATPTTQLTHLIDNTNVLLDSLVTQINTFPLVSAQTSIIKQLMLAEGNADKLKTHFEALNHFVSSEFSLMTLDKDKFNLIKVEKEDWGKYLFDGRTVIATKVLLLKWKKDLKYFESRVLSLWLKKG